MTTNTLLPSSSTSPAARPGAGRRTALAVTGFLACFLPAVFAFNMARFLLTGELPDHRFHQATGQGLLLCAVWLVPLLGLLRAGWAGRRPSAAAGWQHVSFLTVGAVCAAVAPGGGAPSLVAVVAVTGALVWAALPLRPRLLEPVLVDPLVAPLALLATAWFAPYAVGQLQAQDAVTAGNHLHNPHLFDMAWLVGVLMVTGLLAALLPSVRHLVGWLAGPAVVLGAAGLAFGEPTTWSLVTLSLGVVCAAGSLLRRR
ncbi:hypothetical protein [Nocardioides marmoribigeumensis]|uniref:Uncharacterized protein n=1 Tax=Nocardioides marmoribigeumensis TaxID=433649 RepID=A0ABU2BYD9_9ACTN|nr:hypothetical protein [Nocardioides marmoribigeumensis]MDR7363418.1 hypothetical protein [Nocardioides marmoribigeumensis]